MFLLCFALSFQVKVSKHGRIRFSGNQLIDDQGDPIQLRGVSLGWHNFAPEFYNVNAITQLVTNWNVSVVRASIGVETEDAFVRNPDFAFESVRNVIEASIKNDIYVIIDWHSHHIRQQEAINFFSKISLIYKGFNNIIYEIFNEPDYNLYTWNQIKEYSLNLIKSIRQNDNNNLILVGTPGFDTIIEPVVNDPLTEFNIGYTVHFYSGTHNQSLRDQINESLVKGIPIFISECGSTDTTFEGDLFLDEFDDWLSFLDEKKISWVVWSVSSGSRPLDLLTNSTDSYALFDESDISQWGSYIKKKFLS